MKFLNISALFALIIANVNAASYGSSGGGGGATGTSSSRSAGIAGGYTGGYGGSSDGGASGSGGFAGGIISAAIQSRHNIEFRDVPSTGSIQPAMIEVGASAIPVNILFRSASSNLNIVQQHEGAGGDTQESTSEDEPHRLLHTVTKPIIQEVREVISPFRKITQTIEPVQEEIQTIVARGVDQGHVGAGMNGLGAGGSGGRMSTGGATLGGSGGGGISILSGPSSMGISEIKATSGTKIGKGLAGKSASGYASPAKASGSGGSGGSSKGGY